MGEAKRKQEDFEKQIAALRISYKQVFETDDGKKVLSGVYVYILEIEYPDGTSQRFTGDVTLF